MIIPPETKYIFIWVPGTGGHKPHPAFKAAIEKLVHEPYVLLHVDYPAEWKLAPSVKKGIEATKALLDEISPQLDRNNQKVLMGGSSQGSWVLNNVLEDPIYTFFPDKVVMFGHPGTDTSHQYHNHFDGDDTVWEINDPRDAVTFGWNGREQEVVDTFSKAQDGSIKDMFKVLWLALTHPVRLTRLVSLAVHHAGWLPWSRSPHDYSQQMPLAVYWLTH